MINTPQNASLALRARLGEMDGTWLHLRCRCGRGAALPLRLMIGQHGRGPYIGSILPRLKCKGCGAAPAEASLRERGDTGAAGGAQGGWSIPLLPTGPGVSPGGAAL